MELPVAVVSLQMALLKRKLFNQIQTIRYEELMVHLKAHREARRADPTASTSCVCWVDGGVTGDSGCWLIVHTGNNIYGKYLVMSSTVRDVPQVYLA